MKGDCDTRIFVALFPYDPATMSPNPDAAEEELPFSEGQIIKVRPELFLLLRISLFCVFDTTLLFPAGAWR